MEISPKNEFEYYLFLKHSKKMKELIENMTVNNKLIIKKLTIGLEFSK